MARKSYPIESRQTGARHGSWTLLEQVSRVRFVARCDCGTQRLVFVYNLLTGLSKSCGCKSTFGLVTHGGTGTVEHSTWKGMRERCFRPNHQAYRNYGGRGITVCERWKNSFAAFFEDMGPRPSDDHSLDRIDNDGNYEPGNCRWATWDVQCSNRRPGGPPTKFGVSMAKVAASVGISRQAVSLRLKKGWTLEDVSSAGAYALRRKSKPYQCGLCGAHGHNRASCSRKPEAA